jgi:hypothetical protein
MPAGVCDARQRTEWDEDPMYHRRDREQGHAGDHRCAIMQCRYAWVDLVQDGGR